MSTGKTYYWCGWGLLVLALAMIILSGIEGSLGEPWAIGSIGGMFFFGFTWLRIGSRRIAAENLTKDLKARGFPVKDENDLIKEHQQRQLESLNCNECRYFTQSKCTKQSPSIESTYCYSFEPIPKTAPRPTL